MYYVYFLLEQNNQIYTGLTKDLRRRISEHNAGKVRSTKSRSPLRLVGYGIPIKRGCPKTREIPQDNRRQALI